MKPKLLVSACLLGTPCRYDGKSKKKRGCLRSCGTVRADPRLPRGARGDCRRARRASGARVVRKDGRDVTAGIPPRRGMRWRRRGAGRVPAAVLKNAARAAAAAKFTTASFTGALTAGDGVTAELLKANGITVYGEGEQSLTEFLCSVSHST